MIQYINLQYTDNNIQPKPKVHFIYFTNKHYIVISMTVIHMSISQNHYKLCRAFFDIDLQVTGAHIFGDIFGNTVFSQES